MTVGLPFESISACGDITTSGTYPYRQCSKYFHQYIDHLVVPRKTRAVFFR